MIRPQTLREAALLGSAAAILGILNVRLREAPLAWIAPPKPLETACSAPPAPVPDHQRIDIVAAKALLGRDDVTWVDARSGALYARAHLPQAISLPIETAIDMLPVQSLPIPPDNLVVTYCDGGPCELSEALAHLLAEQAGCARVRVLDGGFQAWVNAGLAVEHGSPAGSAEGRPPGVVARISDEPAAVTLPNGDLNQHPGDTRQEAILQ